MAADASDEEELLHIRMYVMYRVCGWERVGKEIIIDR